MTQWGRFATLLEVTGHNPATLHFFHDHLRRGALPRPELVKPGRGGEALAARRASPPANPRGQPTLSATSSTTNDVWREPFSVPVKVSVTVWPAKPATLNVRCT